MNKNYDEALEFIKAVADNVPSSDKVETAHVTVRHNFIGEWLDGFGLEIEFTKGSEPEA